MSCFSIGLCILFVVSVNGLAPTIDSLRVDTRYGYYRGARATLYCTVSNTTASTKVDFSILDGSEFVLISSEEGKNKYQDKMEVVPTYGGEIPGSRIHPLFTLMNGIYRCTVTDDNSPGESIFKEATVKFKAIPVINATGWKYRHRLDEGQEFTLICNATGSPTPSVYWQKKNDHDFLSGPVLQFLSVSEADKGGYECIADNGIRMRGKQFAKEDILIQVDYFPPRFTADETFLTITKGFNVFAMMKCIVEERRPIPEVTWWRYNDTDLASISGDNVKYFVRSNTIESSDEIRIIEHRLFIGNLQLSDSGIYVARAENRLGTSQIEFNLEVDEDHLLEVSNSSSSFASNT